MATAEINGQQSQDVDIRKGIAALEGASESIKRIQAATETIATNLRAKYKGIDGEGFGAMMAAWHENTGIIRSNVDKMHSMLMTTSSEHKKMQTFASEAIADQSKRSDSVFSGLTNS